MTLVDEAILDPWEIAARMFETKGPRWRTPGALAKHLNDKTVQTPALDLVDAFLLRAANEPDFRGIITIGPQEGKSTRVAHDFIVWWLEQFHDSRVVGASYSQSLANRNGRAVRRTIQTHDELGIRIAKDNGAAHEWEIESSDPNAEEGQRGGLFSVGVGGSLTGRPADLLIIDDPIKDRKEADSEVYRQNVWDWWTDVASSRLAPGAPVVVILTRWHEDDLAGRLLAESETHWELLNIPAQADHDPAKGETDVLGREPGEFMVSARGRTPEQWELRKKTAGSRTWNALYQGRPSTPEGNTFKRDWWKFYYQPQFIVREDGSCHGLAFHEIIFSWDMNFKEREDTDFVVGAVWGRRGADVYLLDLVRGRWDFPTTLKQFVMLTAKWPQATLKLVEDKANGPAVIASLRRRVVGIVEEEPLGSKEARADAVTPLVEAGNVYLPDPTCPHPLDPERMWAPWVGDFVEEHAAFPNGVNDDMVDTTSQALLRLVIKPIEDGEVQTVEDLVPELAMHGLFVP